jgi:hypothetical protein
MWGQDFNFDSARFSGKVQALFSSMLQMTLSDPRSRWTRGPVTTALALTLSLPVYAGPPASPEKVEISEPTTPLSVSNLDQLGSLKLPDAPGEDDLAKFFQQPRGSAAAIVRPAVQLPLTQQQQDSLNLRKNWAFTTTDDLVHEKTAEDVLQVKQYGPDGLEKKSTDPITRFLDARDPAKPPQTLLGLLNSLGAGRNHDFAGTNAYNPNNFAYGTNGVAPWAIFSSETHDDVDASQPSWAGGATTAPNAMEKARALQHHRDFDRLLNGSDAGHESALKDIFGAPAPKPDQDFGNFPGGSGDLGQPALAPPPLPVSAPAPALDSFDVPATVIGTVPVSPVFHDPSLDDPTRRALGLPQLDTVKPVLNQEPVMRPPAATYPYNLPTRPF